MFSLLKRNLFIITIFIFTISLSFLTFLTFIGKSFIKIDDENIQILIIVNISLLLLFFFKAFFGKFLKISKQTTIKACDKFNDVSLLEVGI